MHGSGVDKLTENEQRVRSSSPSVVSAWMNTVLIFIDDSERQVVQVEMYEQI